MLLLYLLVVLLCCIHPSLSSSPENSRQPENVEATMKQEAEMCFKANMLLLKGQVSINFKSSHHREIFQKYYEEYGKKFRYETDMFAEAVSSKERFFLECFEFGLDKHM